MQSDTGEAARHMPGSGHANETSCSTPRNPDALAQNTPPDQSGGVGWDLLGKKLSERHCRCFFVG